MKTLLVLSVLITLISCGKDSDKNAGTNTDASAVDIQEWGQQIGDVMASIDEAGNSSGVLGLNSDFENKFVIRVQKNSIWNSYHFLGEANAVTCNGFGFAACNSGVVLRTLGGCTIGAATLTGTVLLTWGSSLPASCVLSAAGDTITRSPDFTVTGRRGATLTVSKSASYGQKLTWASGASTAKVFEFTSDGIRRVFRLPAGTVLFDLTSKTNSAVTVTGTSRTGRTLSGGSIKVTDNVTGVNCDLTPNTIKWTASSCNCPVSGSWSGSCSDNKVISIEISGCGTGTISLGAEPQTQSFSFDRCQAS